MRKLFFAIAGAAFLIAAPAYASDEAVAKAATAPEPVLEAVFVAETSLAVAASTEASSCAVGDCGTVERMRAIGKKYATGHRRGRAMSMSGCQDYARAADAQRASIRFATSRRRAGAGVRYASAAGRGADAGFTMWA